MLVTNGHVVKIPSPRAYRAEPKTVFAPPLATVTVNGMAVEMKGYRAPVRAGGGAGLGGEEAGGGFPSTGVLGSGRCARGRARVPPDPEGGNHSVSERPQEAARPPSAWRDGWLWISVLSVVPLLLGTRGAPRGEAVAEDFDFLRRAMEPGVSFLDGGGSQAFWRPVAHQLYYETFGSLILSNPEAIAALRAAGLALAGGLLYRAFRRGWSGPLAAAAASFPLMAESSRTLILWPSHFVDLGGFLFLALAVHEAASRRLWTSSLSLGAALLCKELALVGALLQPSPHHHRLRPCAGGGWVRDRPQPGGPVALAPGARGGGVGRRLGGVVVGRARLDLPVLGAQPKPARERGVRHRRLRRRFPSLARGSAIGLYAAPLSAEYAYSGPHALQVWYRDTTLVWVPLDTFEVHRGIPVLAFVGYELRRDPQVVLLDGVAVREALAGFDLLKQERWRESLERLRRAEAAQQDSHAVVFRGDLAGRRAYCQTWLGEWDGAERDAAFALAAAPEDVGARYVMALVHARRRDWRGTRAELDNLLAMDPRHPEGLQLRRALDSLRVGAGLRLAAGYFLRVCST